MKIRLFAALLIALFSLSALTGCATGNLEAQPTKKEEASQPPVGALTALEAEEIATTHAKVESGEITGLHTELEYDDGVYKYDVEFISGDSEYEYKVDAQSGDILYSKAQTKTVSEPQDPAANKLTAEKALEIALQHAGLSLEQVTWQRTVFDYDDGRPEYDVEFYCNGIEYEYEIHAITGKILSYERDGENASAIQPPVNGEKLTVEQAGEIALNHAGLTKDQVTGLKTTFDNDDGRPEYDVEFYYNGTEYDYEIHATTGEILSHEKDAQAASAPEQSTDGERLTAEQVKEIALNHAGLTKDQVSGLRAEFDYDDGRPEYDVEFRHNGWEYDYEIHAQTGKILNWDKEIDD